jgi:cyanophycin synthetase
MSRGGVRIISTRRLRGPNAYLARPVLVARVELGELTERETTEVDGFATRLLAMLPGLAEHHCAEGAPGGFVTRLRAGTYFGHVSEHTALELSTRLGRAVTFGRTVGTGEPGVYDVITECPRDEPAASALPRRLLESAIEVVQAVLTGAEPDCDEVLAELREEYERSLLGPSTDGIAAAARARGVPVERVGASSLLRLGHGVRSRRVWAAMTDQTSAVAVDVAGDKQLTRQLLDDAGVPVPLGGPAGSADDAEELFAELGPPVVVKPRDGRQGTHVYLGLRDADAVRAAYEAAAAMSPEVVVEQQFDGVDYRVLAVGGRIVAAAQRVAAHVVGDGSTDIAGLVEQANTDPRRGAGHGRPLTSLAVDDSATALLARQGHLPCSVPPPGETVWLRENANLSTGGTAIDVTDRVHPDVADLCRRVTALIGLDIAGIDLRLPDIADPLPAVPSSGRVAGGVIEVNAVPGLRMHLEPTTGTPRDVAGAIVEALYPGGDDGRIPSVAITGTNGKTTTARLTAHLLARHRLRVGLTTTDGVCVGGRLVRQADATGPRSAQAILGDPTVEAAVLETARGGMMREGLGYDWTEVGVITNVTADHLGQDGLRTIADIADVKALVAERVRAGGTLVLNADSPPVRELVDRPRTRAAQKRVVWFTVEPDSPLVVAHRAGGGHAYLLKDGWLTEAIGDRETRLLRVQDLPGGFGGAARHAMANALAAAAAARALGVPCALVADGLRTFQPDSDNPGRGMLLRHPKVSFLVDYAHNPAAIGAVTDTLRRLRAPERTLAVVTLPGDRSDDLLAESARVIAAGFDRVVLYEDTDRRGRAPGEVRALLRREIYDARPGVRCTETADAAGAIAAAVEMAEEGDLVLVLYEKADDILAALRAVNAVPVTEPVPALG